MKRIVQFIVVIPFMMLFDNFAYSQIKINKGIKVGLNISNLSLEPKSIFKFSNYPGFTAGFFIGLEIFGPINLNGEFLFSQKGAKFKTTSQEIKVHINYIDIPILIEFSELISTTTSFIIQGGPYISYKLNEDWQPSDYNPEENFFKNSDYGITCGGGIKINTTFSKLRILARYSFSLLNIEKGELEAKNRNVALTLDCSF